MNARFWKELMVKFYHKNKRKGRKQKMKKFIKYMLSDFNNASRNKRELSVVAKFDCEIIVCAVGKEECVKTIDGYTVFKRTNKLSKNSVVRKFQIVYNWVFKQPQYLRNQNADYISCHNLIALFIGWLSTWFLPKKKKPRLIYDSHEFEIGRNSEGKRSNFAKWIIPKVEKFLMKKCAFNIMVNDSIANEVQKIHKLKERPIVVRNMPNYWVIDDDICVKRRKEICEYLQVSMDTFIVMYHGGVMRSRGIEALLTLLQENKSVVAVVLGDGETSYLDKLRQMAKQLQVSDRVLFHEAVQVDVLWQYIGAVDVGMITIPPVTKSYYFMLPNKFFENIQSLTPMICSNFPEVSKIVNKYDIGMLVNPENINEIIDAVEKMQTNKDMYNKFKSNLKRAKEELCWENEREVVKEAYAKILR
jgi:glycosyltransferase involved in cell wall biosynthesis